MDHTQTTTIAADPLDPSPAARAARLAANEASQAACRSDSIAYYIRRLAGELAREDVPRVDRQIPFDLRFETPADQWRVWCLDSTLWAVEEYQAGRALFAFRGLLQAQEYRGRMGWPTSLIADALSTLRNLIEDEIRKAGHS
jgi:hypothetical protein